MQKKQLNYNVLLNKIGVSRGTCDLLCIYYDMLNYWNKKINLVSRKSIETSWERHFLDSAQLWLHLPYKARKWLDFGSGAGFPALVLAVISRELQPDLKLLPFGLAQVRGSLEQLFPPLILPKMLQPLHCNLGGYKQLYLFS